MNILILILLGMFSGMIVTKSKFKKGWDIFIGGIGGLVFAALNSELNLTPNHNIIYFVMLGSVLIIYFFRFLKSIPAFPQS